MVIDATTPARAGLYVRISKDRDGTMLGVERQRVDGERLIAARGWQLVASYVDNDLSAYTGKVRPGYQRLLEDIEAGRIDVVVAWHPDRLHRSPTELETFVEIVDRHHVAVETVTAGLVDLSTPTGRMVARIVGATAKFESEHKAERQRRKHRELADRGVPIRGGSRPFGLTKDWSALVPDEAAVIRELAERILAGESIRGLCIELRDRGITTPLGGWWGRHTMRRMLMSWRLAGYRGTTERAGQGTWPAVLDVVTVERLRSKLSDPARRAVTIKRTPKYLLTGLLRCGATVPVSERSPDGICRRSLVGRPSSRGGQRYGCPPKPDGCGGSAIMAPPLDELISAMVIEAVDTPGLATAILRGTRDDGSDLAVQLRADRDALEELARDYYHGRVIGRAEYMAARVALEGRATETQRQLSYVSSSASLAALAGRASDRWGDLTTDARRAVISAVVDRVTISPGLPGRNRFDPGRVEVTWRA